MKFVIGIAQMSPRLGDLPANLERVLALGEEARGRGVDLLVFPELALTGYFVKDMVPDLALRADAPELARLAAASRDISLAVGFVEETEDHRFFNSAGYFEAGELLAVHRKVYLPTYGMFDEERYFSRGDRVRTFRTRFGRVGMLVCEDYWHVTLPYLQALEGAHLMLALSASPGRDLTAVAADEVFAVSEVTHSIVRTWAKLLSVYFVFANRVGFEDGVNFWGGSEVVGPSGAVAGQAARFDEALLVVPADTDQVRRERLGSGTLGDEDPDLTLRELDRILRERRGLPGAGDDSHA